MIFSVVYNYRLRPLTFNDSLFHSFTTFLIQIKVNSKSSPTPNGLMFTSNFFECQNIISDPVIHGSLNNIHFFKGACLSKIRDSESSYCLTNTLTSVHSLDNRYINVIKVKHQ